MPTAFDPYCKWLGIPPEHQPPNHYRLLAISLFESDPDVIASAADQRMGHVRTFQSGKNSALSQKILNEIAAARVCLLNPTKKAEYDRALQRYLGSRQCRLAGEAGPDWAALRSLAPPSVQLAEPGFDAPPALNVEPFPARRRRRREWEMWQVLVAIGTTVALCVGIAVIITMTRSGRDDATQDPHVEPPPKKLKKPPIPSDLQLKEAFKRIGKDLEGKSSEELLEAASNGDHDDAERYVVLSWGLNLAAHAGKVKDVLRAIEMIGKRYKVDQPQMKQIKTDVLSALKEALDSAAAAGNVEKTLQILSGLDEIAEGLEIDVSAMREEASSKLIQAVCSAAAAGEIERSLQIVDKIDREYGIDKLPDRLKEEAVTGLTRALYSAAAAGDIKRAWWAAEETARRFPIDEMKVKAEALKRAREGAETSATFRAIAEKGLELIDQAWGAAWKDVAWSAAEVTLWAARKTTDNSLIRRATAWVLVLNGDLAVPNVYPAPPPESKPNSRARVPDDGEVQKAKEDVSEVIEEDLSRAKTPAEKRDLALKLVQESASVESGSASRYALLHYARDLAVEAGYAKAAFWAVDEMAETFQIDGLTMKAAAVPQLLRPARSVEQNWELATSTLDLVEEAIARDDRELATQLVQWSFRAARKTGHPPLLKDIAEREKEVLQAFERYPKEQIASAWETLDQKPLDPQANRVLGEYLCLVQGEWEQGVAMLALGSDGPLKAQAVKDLIGARSPERQKELAERQKELADGWWGLSEKAEGRAKRQLQSRAVDWYRRAMSGLTGLERELAERRIGVFQDLNEPPPPGENETRKETRPGDVR